MTQQGSKAFITDLLHFTTVIGCKHFPFVRIGNRTGFLHFCCQSDVPAGSANAQFIIAAFKAKKINLTDYDITNAPYFSDGVCKIEFKNNMGTKYRATIDKNGKFVQEPEKVS